MAPLTSVIVVESAFRVVFLKALDQAWLALEALSHEGIVCDTFVAALTALDDRLHDAGEDSVYQARIAAIKLGTDLGNGLSLV